ncbi:hypothetical protein AM587_10003740 [Phytophthora nicotianae]|uniref:Uncharacterized protein n=1 Tax=Phytophthora nicotianae TaxID=4792 RepID=A0A0W8C8T8_PHYNI|nr:hypothetical protein AM587_10003740 [Phytophthora nicotianae]
MESMELKRIVDATERMQIGNCDATPAVTMEEAEENLLVEHQEIPGLDTPEYWQSVFDVLGEEASDWDGNFDEESDYEASEDEQNREVDEPVYNGFDEVIPLPDKREFPRTNDPSFPGDKVDRCPRPKVPPQDTFLFGQDVWFGPLHVVIPVIALNCLYVCLISGLNFSNQCCFDNRA